MDYISQSPTHSSKGNLECVLKCTSLTVKQDNGYMFGTNYPSIEHQYEKLGDGFKPKRGRISTHALCLITSSIQNK